MTTGHLVTHLKLALDGNKNLDQFDHTGRKLIASLKPALFLFGDAAKVVDLVTHRPTRTLQLLFGFIIADTNIAPKHRGNIFIDIFGRNLLALGKKLTPMIIGEFSGGNLADDQFLYFSSGAFAKNSDLIALVLDEPSDFLLFDLARALILAHTLAREDAGLDHRALDSRRNLERGIAHFTGLLTKDRTKQFFFRRKLRLALRRDLAHQECLRGEPRHQSE